MATSQILLNIRFKTIDGTEFEYEFTPDTFITDVKKIVVEKFQNGMFINPSNLKLIYNDTNLEDFHTLKHYNIHDKSVIRIVIQISTSIQQVPSNGENQNPIRDVIESLNSCPQLSVTSSSFDENHDEKSIKKNIRQYAGELLKRGVAGLIVIPDKDEPDRKRIVQVNREQLEFLKKVRDVRTQAGNPCLNEGTDTDVFNAMSCVLNNKSPEVCVEKSNDIIATPENINESSNIDSTSTKTMSRLEILKSQLEEAKKKRKLALENANKKL